MSPTHVASQGQLGQTPITLSRERALFRKRLLWSLSHWVSGWSGRSRSYREHRDWGGRGQQALPPPVPSATQPIVWDLISPFVN